MSHVLIVEENDAWRLYYRTYLPKLPLEVIWAESIMEAARLWKEHRDKVTAVILDENTGGPTHKGPPSFASQIIADWKERDVYGILVIAADTPAYRKDMPLAGYIDRGLKAYAITMVRERLQEMG